MKKTYLLAILFFAGLGILWGLDHARVPHAEERLARMNRVLPSLFDVPPEEIERVEIVRGGQRMVFERRDAVGKSWQMQQPFEAAADPAVLNNLIRNLIDLPKSADAGTIIGPARDYGLEPPEATVRISAHPKLETVGKPDIHASLEIGKARRDARFVRAEGEPGIEAVDAKLLTILDRPVADWREKALVPVPTFEVVALSVGGREGSYEVERDRAGRWTLRKPVAVPADATKIENILAALTALRVSDGAGGHVANDVRDFSKYGLDHPGLTVEIRPSVLVSHPIVLQFGSPAADKPDRVYLRKLDQDEVVLVDAKVLDGLPRQAKDLRVSKVSVIDPARVAKIRIDAPSLWGSSVLEQTASGWEQTTSKLEKVDVGSVRALIAGLDGLQSSELLDPVEPDDPRMTSTMKIELWQRRTGPPPGPPLMEAKPALSLEIGRYDALRKTVYARLEGDSVILALPDSILKVLPKNSFAFRDREVLALNPGQLRSLRLQHDGRDREVVPSTAPGQAEPWVMSAPVQGRVDLRTLSAIFASLSRLRAEEFVAEAKDDGQDRRFGLDRPSVEMTWETESKGRERLRIGGRAGRTSASYARLDGLPVVFTLDAATVRLFESELRDHAVFSFDAARAFKIVLRRPGRTAAFLRRPGANQTATAWTPDPETDARGIDVARIPRIVSETARLETVRFLQDEGAFPMTAGLTPPRLTVEVHLVGDPEPRILRIGNAREGGHVLGATGDGDRGPIFFLSAAWNQLVESDAPESDFPDEVFAPPVIPDGVGP